VRQRFLGALVADDRQAELLKIVEAGRPPGRLTGRLHGRQQETHERPDDRDDDEQFDQREAPPLDAPRRIWSHGTPHPEKNEKGMTGKPMMHREKSNHKINQRNRGLRCRDCRSPSLTLTLGWILATQFFPVYLLTFSQMGD
jgi:hypothetical protein